MHVRHVAANPAWSARSQLELPPLNTPVPDCLPPVEVRAAPRWKPPPGAWDTHFHVLGPQHRFAYAATRKYTPPDAPLANCLRMHDQLGIDHGLVVHANTHGFDNGVDLDAVAGSNGRYLGVVRLDASVTTAMCEQLHDRGVRGVRFAFNPQHGGLLDLDVFQRTIGCIEALGWFVELHFDGNALPELEQWLRRIPVNVVIDHIGRIDVSAGMDQLPFRILSELARRPNVWIKLSGADRLTKRGYPYDDVAPFVEHLAHVSPERLLWGSDWPHTGVFDRNRMPDDAQLIDALVRFVPDLDLRCRILVDNPQRLLRL